MGTEIMDYLHQFKSIKNNFDVVAVDIYPGLFHWPLKEAGLGLWRVPFLIFMKSQRRKLFGQLGLLKEAFEELASWDGIEYELGETGFPSNRPWNSEKQQARFFEIFLGALKKMLIEFQREGIRLPTKVGLYQAIDETPRSIRQKLTRLLPVTEFSMGMRRRDGVPKKVLM